MPERFTRHGGDERDSLARLDHGHNGVELGALDEDLGGEARAATERDRLPAQAVRIVHQDHGLITQDAEGDFARFAKRVFGGQGEQEFILKEIEGLQMIVRNRRTEEANLCPERPANARSAPHSFES